MTARGRYFLRAYAVLFAVMFVATLVAPLFGGFWGYGIGHSAAWVLVVLWGAGMVIALLWITHAEWLTEGQHAVEVSTLLWDDAEMIADLEGETLDEVIEQFLSSYVAASHHR